MQQTELTCWSRRCYIPSWRVGEGIPGGARKGDREAGLTATKSGRFCTALLSRLAKQRQADLAQQADSVPILRQL